MYLKVDFIESLIGRILYLTFRLVFLHCGQAAGKELIKILAQISKKVTEIFSIFHTMQGRKNSTQRTALATKNAPSLKTRAAQISSF